MGAPTRVLTAVLAILAGISTFVVPGAAQELEPRRWSHLPIDSNYVGGAYAYTGGDISLDPVLRVEEVGLSMQSLPLKYIRTFEFLGKSARVDLLQSYEHAKWSGLVDGVPATTTRKGWSDTSLRFAVNVLGAPALNKAEFAEYQAETDADTIVGLGLVVQFPTGH